MSIDKNLTFKQQSNGVDNYIGSVIRTFNKSLIHPDCYLPHLGYVNLKYVFTFLVYYTLSACLGHSHLSRIRHSRPRRILTNMTNYMFRRRPRGALRHTIYTPTVSVAVLTLRHLSSPPTPPATSTVPHVYAVTGNNKSETYTRVARDVFIVLHTSDGCVCVCVVTIIVDVGRL